MLRVLAQYSMSSESYCGFAEVNGGAPLVGELQLAAYKDASGSASEVGNFTMHGNCIAALEPGRCN